MLVVVSFGLFSLCQLYLLKDSYPVEKLWIGSDYASIYSGTHNLIRAGTPYTKDVILPTAAEEFAHVIIVSTREDRTWYTYPPLAAYLNYPLSFFSVDTASQIIFFLLIAAVIGAYALINRSFPEVETQDRRAILFYGLLVVLLSYPFYFLIARGQFLGIVILLLALGIYYMHKNSILSGVFLGLSIGTLLFPALILIPLVLFRRYKVILYTMLTLVLVFLCSPNLWLFFVNKMLMAQFLTIDLLRLNCSLANTFNFLHIFFNGIMTQAGIQFRLAYYNEAALVVYFLMLAAMILADYQIRKREGALAVHVELALLLMYLPHMIAFRKVTFQYTLVMLILLIPAICSLVATLKNPMPRVFVWLFVAGIVLSQMQARAFESIFSLPYSVYFHFLPGFGLFMVMIGCVFFKFWFWLIHEKQHTPVSVLN